MLVDGQLRAIWRSDVDRRAGRATVVVEHARVPKRQLGAIEQEAGRAARFWHAGIDHDVRLTPLASL